jgi:hypothetical protein
LDKETGDIARQLVKMQVKAMEENQKANKEYIQTINKTILAISIFALFLSIPQSAYGYHESFLNQLSNCH